MTPAPETISSSAKTPATETTPASVTLEDVTNNAFLDEKLQLKRYAVEGDGPVLTIPPSWKAEWFRIEVGKDQAAAALRTGSMQVTRIRYSPLDKQLPEHSLLEIYGFAQETWNTLKDSIGSEDHATVRNNDDMTWVIFPAQNNPYPYDSEDFNNFSLSASSLPLVYSEEYDSENSDKAAPAAGVYSADLPAADAPGRKVRLELRASGIAVLTTEYIGKGEEEIKGRWTRAENVVAVKLGKDEAGKPQIAMSWTQEQDSLIPRNWDRSLYGERGLPLKKQSAE